MPFSFVSAWNKRRRSKSYDNTDPCTLSLQLSPFNSVSHGCFSATPGKS